VNVVQTETLQCNELLKMLLSMFILFIIKPVL